MGQAIQRWHERSDSVSVTLYSAPIDASSVRDGTIFLRIIAIGTATVAVRAEESLDPTDPNGWSAVGSTASGAGTGNQKALFGGYTGGTTQPVGPFVRFVATVTVTADGVTWSAAVVLRD